MLILTRKVNQVIRIGDLGTIRVVKLNGDRVKLAFAFPDTVRVDREEVAEKREQRKQLEDL